MKTPPDALKNFRGLSPTALILEDRDGVLHDVCPQEGDLCIYVNGIVQGSPSHKVGQGTLIPAWEVREHIIAEYDRASGEFTRIYSENAGIVGRQFLHVIGYIGHQPEPV